jgi:hypothetical protein
MMSVYIDRQRFLLGSNMSANENLKITFNDLVEAYDNKDDDTNT